MPPKEKELSRYLKRKLEVKEADFDLQLHMKEQIELSSINVRDVAGNEVQPQQQLSSSFESRPPEVFDLTYETCGNTGDTDIDIEASNADELFGNNTYEEDDMDDYIFMEGLKDCDRANYLALVCLAYKLKHRLSNAAFKDHLRILKLFTGSTVEEMTSAAKCAEKYKKLIQPTKKVFVCNEKDCDTVLNTGADGVPLASQPCGHRFSKEKKYCYFLVLSIEQQIQYLLESGAAKWFDSKQNCDGKTRGDIQTGDLYREKVRITDELIRYITLQLNTDGAECHKKSKFTFWAFMGIPNELPYFLRRSNIFLFAIWYGNKKPPSGPFLEASISELQHLGTKGVQFNQRTYLVKPLILTTDSMARSVFLNGSTFRGECGCDFCLHPGEMIKIGRGSTRVYPEPTSNPTFAPRTVEQHERDLMTVLGTGKRLNGIKGPSPFLALLDFDYVQAQVPDYLHCVCHGGIKFLVALWTETKYFKQPWYLDERKTAILNARLMQMKPPYEITRTSSPLSDISQWKASNFRAFALYYFTALEDLLPKVYFDHFLCLIYGIQVLLQEEVTVNLVLDVDFLLQHFVREAEVLYEKKNMRFNFHLTTHLVRATLNWGCIWSWSTFIPEWFNGVLVSSTNGTQCVPEQMVKNLLMKKAVRSDAITLMLKYNLPQNVSELLKDFLNISHHDLLSSLEIDSSVFNLKLLGVPKKKFASKECKSAIQKYFSSVGDPAPLHIRSYYSYKRFLFGKKAIFTTTSYTRSPKRINYCAYMKNDVFFMIEEIVSFNFQPDDATGNVFLLGRIMGSISKEKYSPAPKCLESLHFCNLPGQSTKCVGLSSTLVAFSASDILKKAVIGFNNCLTETYVVTALPNSVETD